MSAVLLGLLAALASLLLTWLVIEYAQRAQMHDAPGARRMHHSLTVRGAGLGFVVTVIAFWAGFGAALGFSVPLGRWALCSAVGLCLVAAISWIDDRRGLPVWPRLLAHCLAAGCVTFGALPSLSAHWPLLIVIAVPVLILLPAINFWNFVDGVNGFAATQAMVVCVALVFLAWQAGDVPAAWFAAVAAGAVGGFLPYNFPKARAFMGDVGSASLGLMVGALALMPIAGTRGALPAALLLIAIVFLDAGLTLLWRMSRRPPRRWYTGHREHLYQWLTRSGWGHTRTTLTYLMASVAIAALVVFIGLQRLDLMLIAVICTYFVGMIVWRIGRDYALRRARRQA